ncbi:MAG: NADH-quinone oxidoreductase subunit N [Flavobacterium sp.]|nr:NADH-quinone oxidoreductase subunit N [Pedobacter sp.]
MSALITLSIIAIVVLYMGLYKTKNALLPVTMLGMTIALVLSLLEWNSNAKPIYSGMMQFDNFAIAFTVICIFSTMLILLISKDYFERISEHVAEYYAIILFALVGIVVMVSYNNLSMLFIGIEIMSVSLYILAGIRKKSYSSNEAALKYFLMGAFSTGFLLFGITLLYGSTGTFDLILIKNYVLNNPTNISPLFYSGILLLIIGLGFKVGVAPFHFWAPDVYEGSPTLITAFMSTVVKTAGFAAFLRIFLLCFAPLHDFWMMPLLVITVLTLFIGNITALYQNSFKRMLGFSSVSHAGYMMFAIVALGTDSINAVILYATAYSLASIIAFAALILVKRQMGSDKFESFNGLGSKNPFMALNITVAMLSLAGIPLTAGFIGKFLMFSTALSDYHVWLVIMAVINAIIGIFYYLRVVVAMYFKESDQTVIRSTPLFSMVLAFSTIITILLGIYPGFISNLF